MTWAERALLEADLRAFVQAEIARAGIDAQAWKVEAEHRAEVIQALQAQVRELTEQAKRKKK